MKKLYDKYIKTNYKFTKKELIGLLFLIAIISGFTGFLYEYIFYYINGGFENFYWRGANFIPWIDIYAIGALFIFFLTFKKRKEPLKVFILSGLSCGLIELIAGILIYIIRDGHRAWNYNTEIWNFGNVYGFICFRSVFVFALFGLILIYIAIPLLLKIVKSKHFNIIFPFICIIMGILLIDEIYNMIIIRLFNTTSASELYTSLGIKYLDSNN